MFECGLTEEEAKGWDEFKGIWVKFNLYMIKS